MSRLGWCWALLLVSCRPGPAPASPPAAPDAFVPQVALRGVRLRYYQGAALSASGTAAQVAFARASGDYVAHDVVMEVVPKSGPSSRPLRVLTPVAQGNLHARSAKGSQGVVLESERLRAKTAEASLFGSPPVAKGSHPVEVRGPGYTLFAQGFSAALREQHFVFEGSVRTELGPRP